MNTLSQSIVSGNHDSERASIQAATITRQRGEIEILATKLRRAVSDAGRLPGDVSDYAAAALAAAIEPALFAETPDETVLEQAATITKLWCACNEVAAAMK